MKTFYMGISIVSLTILLLACGIKANTDNNSIPYQSLEYSMFQDKDFPFTFKYPADWNTVELPTQGKAIGYGTEGKKRKELLIGKNVTTETESRKIEEWIEVSKGETPFPSNDRPPSNKIILDGKEFDIYDIGSGLYFFIVRITVGDNVYEISFNGKDAASSKIISELKSSFKFSKK